MIKTKSLIKQALFLALFFIFSNLLTGFTIFTIPITFQTILICLIPFFFNRQEILLWYITLLIITLMGIPMMNGFKGGLGVLLGPTSGFIYGWLIQMLLMSIALQYTKNVMIRYSLIIIGVIFSLSMGGLILSLYNELSVVTNIMECLLAFLLIELFKVGLAFTLVRRLPRYLIIKELGYGL